MRQKLKRFFIPLFILPFAFTLVAEKRAFKLISSHLAPSSFDQVYEKLKSKLELLHGDRFYTLDLSHMNEEEVLELAEVYCFGDWCLRKKWVNSLTLSQENLIAYFNQYQKEIEAIVKDNNLQALTAAELFKLLNDIDMEMFDLLERWRQFLNVYLKWRQIDYRSDSAVKLFYPDIWRQNSNRLFQEYPGIEKFFAKSLFDFYFRRDSDIAKIKKELSTKNKNNPAVIQELIQALHHSKTPISDRQVNWLLHLDEVNPEKELRLDWSSSSSNRFQREAVGYGGTPYTLLRDVVHKLKLTSQDVFYDLGSGYGRVVYYVALTTEAKVKGIELVPERVAVCNRVATKTLKLNQDKVQFVQGSVLGQDYSDGTVFFLFNPFSYDTLTKVVETLREIAKRKKIRVVTFVGQSADTFKRESSWRGWLNLIDDRGILIFESTLDWRGETAETPPPSLKPRLNPVDFSL